MSDNNDKILNRIRGLLQKAQNVAGTPEADAFNEKAFELLAKYGLDEDDVTGQSIVDNADDDKLIAVTFTFGKQFRDQRRLLLDAIMNGLGCISIGLGDGKVKVFGVARQLRRGQLLHSFLGPQMIAGASRTANTQGFGAFDKAAMRAHRASWMEGFAEGVYRKIDEIEQAAIRQRDMGFDDRRTAIKRKSDFDRAAAALFKAYPNAASTAHRRTRGSGYAAGYAKGSTSGIGQTSVGAQAQRALA
jgi:hypothetical protein